MRERLVVRGVVQGIGFRPFVYCLANELDLTGWVRNTASGVVIEIEGSAQDLQVFHHRLYEDRPPNCIIQCVESARVQAEQERGFSILNSLNTGLSKACSIPPDLATCPACLDEVFDPTNRRFQYPFTNCTACGPRYSLITALPYDRPNTTMKAFAMCAACQSEYNDPQNRRHHAQPNACSGCGPQLSLIKPTGEVLSSAYDAMQQACEAIQAGRIVAVKGLGGFHLMADARNDKAVAELRRRKHRPTKPFAVMLRTLGEVETICEVSEIERDVLYSSSAPIVLLLRCEAAATIAHSVAPGNPCLGVMLANTPLHHLMLSRLGFPIVATSGNLSNEPICINEQQVMQRLGTVADLVLTHDRTIARAVDDSVVQVIDGAPRVLRRSRGYAPLQIPMPAHRGGPILATGSNQKNTIGVAYKGTALLSQHIGDLEYVETCTTQRETVNDLCSLLQAKPAQAITDLHPDYQSTHLAEELGLPTQRVQHHAAHVYTAMAEHRVDGSSPVLGIALDGTGLGDDGTIWGGEALVIRGRVIERAGHLEPFLLPGGDAAARKPSRSAIGVLFAAFGEKAFSLTDLAPVASTESGDLHTLRQMLMNRANTPKTTSAGRLFDAVASLLDLCHDNSFEGEAAMMLQYSAESAPSNVEPLCMSASTGQPSRLDWRPAVREIIKRVRSGEPTAAIARAFHFGLAQGIAQLVIQSTTRPYPRVILTGGCFQNKLLAELCASRLRYHGIEPLLHKEVPPNDGGIALGQLYAATLKPNANTENSA